MQTVIKVDKTTLAKMTDYYGQNFKKAPGVVFRHKQNGTTITGYRTGKVLFQGPGAQKEAAKWTPTSSQEKIRPAQSNGGLPTGFDQLSVIGSDEVGVGSYFGPLTVAAVYVDHQHIEKIENLGVRDSKKLTDPQIIKMAKKIINLCPYHVVNLDPPTYNRLMDKYGNQAQLKALSHNLALAKLVDQIKPDSPDAILIDQFVSPTTYYRYLTGQSTIIRDKVFFHVRGEQEHVAVAAGSIVARYYSLQRMNVLSEKAGITLPIGAGTAVDNVAATLIRHGKDLGQFAKLHFTNTKKAHQLAGR